MILKYFLYFLLSISALAANSQPTSIGGITPGHTKLSDIGEMNMDKSTKSLYFGDYATDNSKGEAQLSLELTDYDLHVTVYLLDGLVYKVETSLDQELRSGLYRKYGRPTVNLGSIRNTVCRNGFGASFNRLIVQVLS